MSAFTSRKTSTMRAGVPADQGTALVDIVRYYLKRFTLFITSLLCPFFSFIDLSLTLTQPCVVRYSGWSLFHLSPAAFSS